MRCQIFGEFFVACAAGKVCRRLTGIGTVVAIGARFQKHRDGSPGGFSCRHDQRRYPRRRLDIHRGSRLQQPFNEFRAAFRSGIVQGRPVAAALRIGSGSDKFIKELVLPLENGEHQRGFAELIEVVDIESAAL